MKLSVVLHFLLLAVLAAGCTGYQPTPEAVPSGLFADASQDLGPISPYVYGTNHGPWSAVPFEMLEQAYQARITHLRFPGGAYGDSNNLQPHHIDQYIDLCRKMGAEPSINVRLKEGTPEAAVALLQHTLDKGYNVRYWGIGNEPTLYATADKMDYDTERFNREWRAIAEAMKAVDPNILLIGPELHQFTANQDANPKDAAGRDWMTEFLKANGDLVDIISIHRYPFPSSFNAPPPTIPDLRNNSQEWDEIIPYLRSQIQEITGKDLPIAVTEVNSNWAKAISGEATPDSFYNAIWWADSLARMIRQDVTIVNHFVLSTSGGQGGWGLVSRGGVRPSYYVYQIYHQFGTQLVHSQSDDPEITILAAQRDDGALTLLLINLADTQRTMPLSWRGCDSPAQASVWLFDETHAAEQTGQVTLSSGSDLTLPPSSVSLYIFEN